MPENPQPLDPGHWQALFSAAAEPVFLLNRQRRILLVNRAWEELTGLTAEGARGLVCRRSRRPAGAAGGGIAASLAPPAAVVNGQPARVRRQVGQTQAGPRWCEVEFVPLMGAEGLLAILGRVVGLQAQASPAVHPLPEKLQTLQRRLAGRYRLDTLSSRSPALRRAGDQARLASQTRVPVLIVGEPGTGKEWLARVIHHHGITADQAFAAIDCERLPPRQLDELLFGESDISRRGDLGTLYLKEPAHLRLDLQAKLRSWLEGPTTARPRVIAGSSTPPAEDMRGGRFLDELRCALGTLEIAIPPLRERSADLPELLEHFLARGVEDGAGAVAGLAPEAWEALRAYRWPGNLDELNAVIQSARRHAKGGRIELADLPAYLRQAVRLEEVPGRLLPRQIPLKLLRDQVERRLIGLALRMARGNKSEAARLLAIERLALLSRMKALEIVLDGVAAKSEIRDTEATKSEIRNPKSETNPKTE